MSQFRRTMEDAVYSMTPEHLFHPFSIGYVGLNGLKVLVAVLVLVDVNVDDAMTTF